MITVYYVLIGHPVKTFDYYYYYLISHNRKAGNALPVESKRLTSITGSGIQSMRLIFEIGMLLYQSKANLDLKIFWLNHNSLRSRN